MEEQESKEKILNKTLYTLVTKVGLSSAEVSKLRLTDLHLAGKSPSLSISTEGGATKSIELDLDAHRALVGWLVSRPDSISDFLFPGTDEKSMTPAEIEQAVNSISDEAVDLPSASKPIEPQKSTPSEEVDDDSQRDAETFEKAEADDATMISSFGPGDLPARPAPAVPPPTNPERGAPPRVGPPPTSRPPSRLPEQGPKPPTEVSPSSALPGAEPFPAQPFPAPPGSKSTSEQTPESGAKDPRGFPLPSSRRGSKPTPRPIREQKPKVRPKPVPRRGSKPIPVNMPGKESETPATPDSVPVPPSTVQQSQESEQAAAPEPVTASPQAKAVPEPPSAKQETPDKTKDKPKTSMPGPVSFQKKTEQAPPPPIPKDEVNRPAIFSFAMGGGIVVLALCVICVGGAAWFSFQGQDSDDLLAAIGLVDVQATADAEAAAIAEETRLAAELVTPTSTATLPATSTPTPLPPTDTPVPTDTPIPDTPTSAAPTDTPAPTNTPVPTDTPTPQPPASTPTPAETPTPEATPTPAMKYDAPVLIEPEDGFNFISGNTIVLRWQPVDLAPDEQYAVRMSYNFNTELTWAGANVKEPEWTVPTSLYGQVDPPQNLYEWFVVIERLNEDGSGTAISPESEHRTFTWK